MSPKITVHGGVTNAFEQGPPGFSGAWSDEDAPNVWPAPDAGDTATVELDNTDATFTPDEPLTPITFESEGGEQPSPGNSSSPSPEKQPTSGAKTKPNGPRRARTTGNRSKTSEASSTAGSADESATN
jgi:hypothetical protein